MSRFLPHHFFFLSFHTLYHSSLPLSFSVLSPFHSSFTLFPLFPVPSYFSSHSPSPILIIFLLFSLYLPFISPASQSSYSSHSPFFFLSIPFPSLSNPVSLSFLSFPLSLTCLPSKISPSLFFLASPALFFSFSLLALFSFLYLSLSVFPHVCLFSL